MVTAALMSLANVPGLTDPTGTEVSSEITGSHFDGTAGSGGSVGSGGTAGTAGTADTAGTAGPESSSLAKGILPLFGAGNSGPPDVGVGPGP